MRKTTVFGLCASLLLSAAFASADDTDTLIELDKKWGESQGADALSPMLADSVIVIGVDGLRDPLPAVSDLGLDCPAALVHGVVEDPQHFFAEESEGGVTGVDLRRRPRPISEAHLSSGDGVSCPSPCLGSWWGL